jgi:hypothetical protein
MFGLSDSKPRNLPDSEARCSQGRLTNFCFNVWKIERQSSISYSLNLHGMVVVYYLTDPDRIHTNF